MSDRLTEIEERLNAATPGPWVFHNEDQIWTGVSAERLNAYDDSHGEEDLPESADTLFYGDVKRLEDGRLIAHAPADVAFLLARVKELETQRDKVLEVHNDGSGHIFENCQGCGNPWPCPTVLALGGAE